MIHIATLHETWPATTVEARAQQFANAMADREINNGIGVYVDISPDGIALLLAAIKLGLRTAICSLREPPQVLDDWLHSLGITTLVSSVNEDRLKSMNVELWFADELKTFSSQAPLTRTQRFASLIRTSGTTGVPKTAVISEAAHKASAKAVNNYFSFGPTSSWALSLPLFHVSGLAIVFRALAASSSVFLARSHEEIFEGLAQQKITHISLVPTQLKRLLNEGADFSGVTAVILGGDAVDQSVINEAIKRELPLFTTYGLTETASMIWVHDVRRRTGGLLPHAAFALSPESEICVGGQSLFDGYVRGQNVEHPILSNGLFKTGDLGSVRGCDLHVHGRTHHRIISGGENIQAEEIERVLDAHPLIEQSVVLGIPHCDLGMSPCAIIEWCDQPLSDLQVSHYLREHLASYKIPKAFLAWPDQAPSGLKKPRAWFNQWIRSQSIWTNLS